MHTDEYQGGIPVFTIRKARLPDAGGIARVHVDSWQRTYSGLIPDEIIANFTFKRRENQWRRSLSAHSVRRCDFVAEGDDGEILGFASGGPELGGTEGYDGELYAIYVQAGYQGVGIGTQLTAAIARCLYDKDMTSMMVWVLATNPYRRFYESLDGIRIAEKVEEYGGASLHVRGYGWSSIADLLTRLEDNIRE